VVIKHCAKAAVRIPLKLQGIHSVVSKTALIMVLLGAGSVSAACPAYLDHELRKLHSRDTVNLCRLSGGGPLLIVNTASHCGFTPQFKQLEALHTKYRERGLTVVGFASDDFRQEANEEAKVAEICYINYGVTFTMLAPTQVRGEEANPVFRELALQSKPPDWNFSKYLVDTSGKVVSHFNSRTTPDDPVLLQAIETVLASTAAP
jgi:glutathione peroxidase